MRALVTGGTGFLGGRLAQRLAMLGWDVTVLGRSEEKGRALSRKGIRFVRADLCDRERTEAACAGADTVFHCAAFTSPWGAASEYYASNVTATRHLIGGCLRQGVERMVHVSTAGIYFDYTDRLEVSERSTLPARPANAYLYTKRLAEQEVESAGRLGLRTVTVRPQAIIGPGGGASLQRLLRANARQGLPLIDGGQAVVDFTYIDNAVDALLLCQAAPSSALGRVYNISNGEPVRLAHILPRLLESLGEKLRARRLSYGAAYGLAAAMEAASQFRGGRPEPLLTRYMVGVLGRSLTVDIRAARDELGYDPRILAAEGLVRLAESRQRG
ncbi:MULTISPECIES: NAD-dependent epimerase/dehydratase family protein [Paenibacillus]|uniref:NAD-dependent epimerase/dehydratase family protein n=1 Tax=Paenibacillus TaxID=44249 RepID=UPI0022B9317F|nr:NAD-dependent epimerase/dehydratase family protein [Paenibacillus caseinilyticus]MCZ8522331.1 NAD-dependent epimerase/dehydratase family protein [Paenibacillus caseinilyticus]